MTRPALDRARRIVVKVGTSLLAPGAGGVHDRRFSQLAADVAALVESRRQIMLVSSGAVGLGARRLGLEQRPQSIPEKQGAAAVGQIDLCRRSERAFARHGLRVGQILLTHTGLADRERFLNARHTLNALLGLGVVPIINENDSVATEELRFGDNDQLAAQVVNTIGADLLVILTDVDGLRSSERRSLGARVSEVPQVTRALLESATQTDAEGSREAGFSSGGMHAKLEAARAASRFGVPTVIANGGRRGVLQRIVAGEDVGTLVHPAREVLSSRKHWIAFSLRPRGDISIDAGAVRALRHHGRSLLPIGVVGVRGNFGVGDLVRCLSDSGDEIARGLISYSAPELDVIKGHRTSRIPEVLGYSNGDEVIHRDDLVVL